MLDADGKEEDDHLVDLLYKRAQVNGASRVSIIDEKELKKGKS